MPGVVEQSPLARISDLGIVRSILTHPDVWPYTTNGYDIDPDSWQPPSDAIYLYETGMLFPLHHDGEALRIHAACLPGFRGREAERGIQAAFRWVFEHTSCRKIVARIARRNRHASLFARRAGMRFTGNDGRDNFEVTPCLL